MSAVSRAALARTSHRPWSLPQRPWVLAMRWERLLFAHWRVPAEPLRRLLPAGLELDLRDGEAWLGVVPFMMRGVTPRGVPPLPGVSAFAELNLRTYVVCDQRPGVWFFSLDATSRLAVRAARRTFRLPYFDATIEVAREGAGIRYRSERIHRGAPAGSLVVRYGPAGAVAPPAAGSLEAWLTERYCLYSATPAGRLLCGEIQHAPWPLQPAEAELERCTLADRLGVTLSGLPLLHYADALDVVAWWPHLTTKRNHDTESLRQDTSACASGAGGGGA